jgi:hypothetical protein
LFASVHGNFLNAIRHMAGNKGEANGKAGKAAMLRLADFRPGSKLPIWNWLKLYEHF